MESHLSGKDYACFSGRRSFLLCLLEGNAHTYTLFEKDVSLLSVLYTRILREKHEDLYITNS